VEVTAWKFGVSLGTCQIPDWSFLKKFSQISLYSSSYAWIIALLSIFNNNTCSHLMMLIPNHGITYYLIGVSFCWLVLRHLITTEWSESVLKFKLVRHVAFFCSQVCKMVIFFHHKNYKNNIGSCWSLIGIYITCSPHFHKCIKLLHKKGKMSNKWIKIVYPVIVDIFVKEKKNRSQLWCNLLKWAVDVNMNTVDAVY